MKAQLFALLFVVVHANNLLAVDQDGYDLIIKNSGNTMIGDNKDGSNEVVQNSGNTLIGLNRGGTNQVVRNSGTTVLKTNQNGANRIIRNSGNTVVVSNVNANQGVFGSNANVLMAELDSAPEQGEIIHIMSNNDHLIKIGGLDNYAIAGASLEQTGTKTVSVNGANVVSMTDTCQTSSQSSNELSDTVREIKTRLEGAPAQQVGPSSSNNPKRCVSRFIKQWNWNNWVSSTNCSKTSLSNFNDLSYHNIDGNHFTASRSYLPNNLLRIFVLGDVVGLIDTSLGVSLKPKNCLSSDESRLVEELRAEGSRAEIGFQQQMAQVADNLSRQLGNMRI